MKIKDQAMGYVKLPPIAEEMGDKARPESSKRYREDATGHLLCWGCGEFGQHGHGYKKEVTFQDGALEMFCGVREGHAKYVACGSSHTAVVTNSDELYLWGNGNSGQLGSNDLNTRLSPQKTSVYSNQSLTPKVAGVACGGRHTMVWLGNGHVFTFGNNFNAQLGFDFRERNFKENQKSSQAFWEEEDEGDAQDVTQPSLLNVLVHRPVAQVACGDKHSVFRFQDGGLACVGCNVHGQIGSGNREDALVPRMLNDKLNYPIKTIAAGSNHTIVVAEPGTIYVWGYSKPCGSRTEDILVPKKMATHRNNIVAVSGGYSHSMALSANGSVYTWGNGSDGQLGHGENVKFLSHPRRVKDRHVISKCVQIACGETFSAAVTEKGLLYMWGKNSHTIVADKPTTHKIFLPHGVNKNFRGGRISKIWCGSWHAVAQIGRPELLLRDEADDSGQSNEELLPGVEDPDDNDAGTLDSDSEEEIMSVLSRREPSKLEREKTTVSLADFYAPTPDPKSRRSPSPEFFTPQLDEEDLDRLNSTRSAATLIVQLPAQPMTSFADAATSPMTLTTTSSNRSSSITTMSRVPSPIAEIPRQKIEKLQRKLTRPEKKFKEFDPQKYEREKLRTMKSPVSEVVQLSKTPADAFTLPREPTIFSKKQVDFSEMEEIRLKGPKSPEKLSRLSRHESSPTKIRELSPTKSREHHRDSNISRSKTRSVDSSMSFKSDSVLMESPLFKGSRNHVTESLSKRPWDAPVTQAEERQYRRQVPKQLPRKYNKPNQISDTNFGLQISRTQTTITRVHGDPIDPSDRVAQLRRYAATHNPHTAAKVLPEKLKPIKHRHVSIPGAGHGTQTDAATDEKDLLFIGGPLGHKDKPAFSSGSTWKDRSDVDRLVPRKLPAAGIVKMYLSNSEVVSTVENPLYTTLSDGRGHSDSVMDSDSLIVQPLLKKRISKPTLPSVSINKSVGDATDFSGTLTTIQHNKHFEGQDFDVMLGNSGPRGIGTDCVVESRVS